ncbi:MAG: VRR-NUC domain-containing protein [Elusimicrobiales bacterium]
MSSLLTRRRFRATRHEREGLNPLEHTEAIRLMDVVDMHLNLAPVLGLLYHIPNGGWRKKGVAKKLKAEGVKPGVPDYCLPVSRQGFHGLYIELKRVEDGAASKDQLDWVDALREQGYRAEVCKGWVEAWAVLCDYLGIRSVVS